mgnify:CR=1 FL=1
MTTLTRTGYLVNSGPIPEIKKELTARVRHQLRSMPQLSFFIDDTLEYVDKMEKLFKEIHSEEKNSKDKK